MPHFSSGRYALRVLAFCSIGLALAPMASAQAHRLYVDDSAAGNHNGTSWADAFTDVQSALDAAEASGGTITEMWIAEGVYKPSKRVDEQDPRSATFMLVDGVALYGGFAGGETRLKDRPFAPTVLSGNIGQIGEETDNTAHVVTGLDLLSSDNRIDGLIIRDGYLALFSGEVGGAGLKLLGSQMTLAHCTFEDNKAWGLGAGVYKIDGDLRVTDCRFEANWADGDGFNGSGSGLYNEGGTLAFNHCRLSNNYSGLYGGGVCSIGHASLGFSHCEFSDNYAGTGAGFYDEGGTQTTVDQCSFARNEADRDGGGIYSSSEKLIVENSAFVDGRAEFDGAIQVWRGGSTRIMNCSFLRNNAGNVSTDCTSTEIVACLFTENREALGSSGNNLKVTSCLFRSSRIFSSGTARIYTDQAVFEECAFIENIGGGGQTAGGIVVVRGNVEIARCQFLGNIADHAGAVMVLQEGIAAIDGCVIAGNSSVVSGGILNYGCVSVRNCTIVDNTNDWEATGGILDLGSCASLVSNSIVWGNKDSDGGSDELAQIYGPNLDVAYSCIQGCSSFCGEHAANNFGKDPHFLDPDGPDDNPVTLEDNDYRLGAFSPCIDSGSNRLRPRHEKLDLDSNLRRVDDPTRRDRGRGRPPIIDRGAYERQALNCMGNESISSAKCHEKKGTFSLNVGVSGGTPGDAVLVELSDGAVRGAVLDGRGSSKVKFRNATAGPGTVLATWGCGARASRTYECP